jgi:hypothetical protein
MGNHIAILLTGIIFIAFAIGAYYVTNLSTTYNIPKGSIWIELGPRNNMTAIRTRMIVTVSNPYDNIKLEVYFKFTEHKKYFISIILPYETVQATPYANYREFHYNETYAPTRIGNISSSFKSFHETKSSVINATFTPKSDFYLFPDETIALSIEAYVHGLVSINYALGSKQTIILTCFGDVSEVWNDEMAEYLGPNTTSMYYYPFRVIVQFPKENYLSSDTFPTPIELFVTERYRSTMFDLNFSYPERYAQSISCSYINPRAESDRQLLTFVSGVLLTTGISLCLESARERRKEEERKMSQEKKLGVPKEKKEEPFDEKIVRLIGVVDRNFKINWYDIFIHGPLAITLDTLVFVAILLELYMLTTTLENRITIALSFFAVFISFSSLFYHLSENTFIEINLKRIGKCAEEEDQQLLKALIKMKSKNLKFNLEDIYRQHNSLFTLGALLERLYE